MKALNPHRELRPAFVKIIIIEFGEGWRRRPNTRLAGIDLRLP